MPAETSGQDTDQITIRAYGDADWLAICAVHDRARPDGLRGSCDPCAFVSLADEQDDAASLQRSRKFVTGFGAHVGGFVGIDGTSLAWLYESEGCQVVRTYAATNAGYPCTCLRLAWSAASAHPSGSGREDSEEAGDNGLG